MLCSLEHGCPYSMGHGKPSHGSAPLGPAPDASHRAALALLLLLQLEPQHLTITGEVSGRYVVPEMFFSVVEAFLHAHKDVNPGFMVMSKQG